MENEELPQYMRIAVSVAVRIADGSLQRGKSSPGARSFRRSIRFPPKRSANPCSCCAICRS